MVVFGLWILIYLLAHRQKACVQMGYNHRRIDRSLPTIERKLGSLWPPVNSLQLKLSVHSLFFDEVKVSCSLLQFHDNYQVQT